MSLIKTTILAMAVPASMGIFMPDGCPHDRMSMSGKYCLIDETGDPIKCDDHCSTSLEGHRVASFHSVEEWQEAVELGVRVGHTKITIGMGKAIEHDQWEWMDGSTWDFQPQDPAFRSGQMILGREGDPDHGEDDHGTCMCGVSSSPNRRVLKSSFDKDKGSKDSKESKESKDKGSGSSSMSGSASASGSGSDESGSGNGSGSGSGESSGSMSGGDDSSGPSDTGSAGSGDDSMMHSTPMPPDTTDSTEGVSGCCHYTRCQRWWREKCPMESDMDACNAMAGCFYDSVCVYEGECKVKRGIPKAWKKKCAQRGNPTACVNGKARHRCHWVIPKEDPSSSD